MKMLIVRLIRQAANMSGQPIPICLLRARRDGDGVVAVGSGVVDHFFERHLVPALFERGIGHGVI